MKMNMRGLVVAIICVATMLTPGVAYDEGNGQRNLSPSSNRFVEKDPHIKGMRSSIWGSRSEDEEFDGKTMEWHGEKDNEMPEEEEKDKQEEVEEEKEEEVE